MKAEKKVSKNGKKKSKETQLQASARNPLKTAFTGPLGLLAWEQKTVKFDADGSKRWRIEKTVVTAPKGWSQVFAFIGGWSFLYDDGDHEISWQGVFVDFSAIRDEDVNIAVKAHFGDKNNDDGWSAEFRVEVLFFG